MYLTLILSEWKAKSDSTWKNFRENLGLTTLKSGPEALAGGLKLAREYLEAAGENKNTHTEKAATQFAEVIKQKLSVKNNPTSVTNLVAPTASSPPTLLELMKNLEGIKNQIREAKLTAMLNTKVERPKYVRKNSI